MPGARNCHQSEKWHRHELMPQLDAETECGNRDKNRHSCHSLHSREQSSGKPEAVEKAKSKCDREPNPPAAAGR